MSAAKDSEATPSESANEHRSDKWLAQEREMITIFFEKLVPETLAPINPIPEQSQAIEKHIICTMEDCNDFTKHILQTDDIRPVENQGATSYTLICPSKAKIVQFRLKRFDEEVLTLAHQIYGDIVPSVTFVDNFLLPVYVSSVIPGQIHIFQKFPSTAFPLERQLTTVKDLARFVAKSAFWPRPRSSYSPTSWTKTAQSTLKKLTQNSDLKRFDPRFIDRATLLLNKIHLLEMLPPVLSHADFAEINILVNSHGNVTGVIDFEDAQTEAFGMCIFGVYEGFFGVMRHNKWSFFDQPAPSDGSSHNNRSVRNVLEATFWDTLWDSLPPTMSKRQFEEAVMVALDIGVVNRYFVRGLLERVDLENEDHQISLEFARGMLLDR